jgi:CRP/FNR family transcriptional regulator, dissimilatory nitrate respiration regulator
MGNFFGADNRMNNAVWLSAEVRKAAITRTLERGEALFHAGQPTAGLYEIVSGTVRLVRANSSGRQTVLHSADAGGMLAEASLFSPTYHCDAIAATAATVRLYPKAAVLDALRRSPEGSRGFMAALARQVMELRTKLQRRNMRSARERVRHFLALNVGSDGLTVLRHGNLKDLATDLGLTHEALYRTLAQMAAAGEIKRSGRKIKLSQLI